MDHVERWFAPLDRRAIVRMCVEWTMGKAMWMLYGELAVVWRSRQKAPGILKEERKGEARCVEPSGLGMKR